MEIVILILILFTVGCFILSKKISRYVQQVRDREAEEEIFSNILSGSESAQEAEQQILGLKEASLELKRKKEIREQIEKELNVEM
jgi:hypothetical protein